MVSMDFSPLKLQIYGLHKSFGMLVLLLAGARVVWRGISVFPKSLDTHKSWEKILSKFVHLLLYAAMIGMPLSGWIMSSAGDFPNIFFGLFEVPQITGKDEALFKLTRNIHGLFAFLLIGIIGLHMAGAFKHHFLDKDATLQRMTHGALGYLSGGALAVMGAILLFAPLYFELGMGAEKTAQAEKVDVSSEAKQEMIAPASSGLWSIDYETSSIKFEATQYGQAFSGAFENFTGMIAFDPEDLDSAATEIEIDISSIKTGSDDRDGQALDGEWFDADAFPKAYFVARSFKRVEANRYEAHGDLTIRGVTAPLILPFTLNITEKDDDAQKAYMDATLVVDRLDFEVGQGQWQSTETIGGSVSLTIHVEAHR